MPLQQIEAFAVLVAMLIAFLTDRIRYELVGGMALILSVILGTVPADKAFEGFASQVIIIIASILVVGRAITISGTIELAIRPVLRLARRPSLQIGFLTACVAFLSAFMKNVGTLGIFMPIAIQAARRSGRSPSDYLMPLAFGSLLGGTITLIGTSPNLLISTVREQVEGKSFSLFDFTPVGLPLTIVGVLFLGVGWRLLPRNRRGTTGPDQQFEIETYTSEVTVPEPSPFVGKTVADIESIGDGAIRVTALVRESGRRHIPLPNWKLFAGDILVLEADPVALKPLLDEGRLALHGAGEVEASSSKDDTLQTVEAVVGVDSLMIGNTSSELHLRQRYQVSLIAISRAGERISSRLFRTPFRPGDVVVLQGRGEILNDVLAELGCLPLADRSLTIGRPTQRYLPLLILVLAMVAIGFQLMTPAVAFFTAAVLVVLVGAITPKEAIESVDWPVVIMLGCLIPVGESLKTTGASDLIGDALKAVSVGLPPDLDIALVLVVSMLVTPFLHHAAAVVVMGPVAAALAHDLGYSPEPFLMAVALGGSCDFLSPIGHQNNALVMGPGGYRFGDYWRLGLPLSILVAIFGTFLIARVWPVH
ncbi:MAG TPA: SLC13 family permease [Alphaproteobacteria bacterium]|nr:SLC13 family permease [Alphaproteobacteria bacterium]